MGMGWSLIGVVLLLSLGCEGPTDGEQVEDAGSAAVSTSAMQGPDARAIRINNRGVGRMGRFEYGAALEAFAGLVAEYPDWLAVKVNLAIATLNRQKEGDERAALALVDAVLAKNPTHLRAHYVAGLLRLYLSSPLEAMGHFAKVAAADPKDAYAAYYLGQCLAQRSEPERALAEYRRALALDPYLRSAAYGAFQALQRLRRREEAREFITQYQRLATNPRARLAEFKYTRMGPKAEALAVGVAARTEQATRPAGPVFAEAAPLLAGSSQLSVHSPARLLEKGRPISITVMDLAADGQPDLLATGVSHGEGRHNLLLRGVPGGGFTPGAEIHPLGRVPDVNGALWGDFDNDGHVDVYLCRRGENRLWRNTGDGWVDVTTESGTGNGDLDTVDGAFFDADHDGDLDLFLVNRDGPNALLHNTLNGAFRPGELEEGRGGKGSFLVIPADLDRDRDADIIVLNRTPPHRVYMNDRLWSYHASKDFGAFEAAPALSATVGDVDSDGWPEIHTLTPEGALVRWSRNEAGAFAPERLPCVGDGEFPCLDVIGPSSNRSAVGEDAGRAGGSWAQMALSDVDGDGTLELLIGDQRGWSAVRVTEGPKGRAIIRPLFTASMPKGKRLLGMAPLLRRPETGHGVAGLIGRADGGVDLAYWPAGPGRHGFLALASSGMADVGKAMRSNASGIGTRIAARVGSRWTIAENFRDHSGPGQSRQPLPIGLGGTARLDFVAIDWSDGVFQSELALEAGRLHRIPETQRQLSSCPVLFAWDGEKYRFMTDFLGVGGMGYALGPPGEYGTPRPWENLLLEGLRPKAGHYVLKLTEPMEESTYLDALGLVVYDLPPGWRMALDERMGVEGPEPTGAAIFYRQEILPERAVNERGETVTAQVTSVDGRAAPIGEPDRRFIGRLAGEHVLTLSFPVEIDAGIVGERPTAEANAPANTFANAPILIIDGWVEYPYSQTMFAAWQADAAWEAPTVEALGRDGAWRAVLTRFGYPAGMPRRISAPLRGLPAGTSALRLRANQEIYWDRVAVAFPETPPRMHEYRLPMASARLRLVGFPERVDGPQRRPRFDYDRRRPFSDTRSMAGFFTKYGPVDKLLREVDGAMAIFGAGEEIHVEFTVPGERSPAGWRRYAVLETHGWTKDRDLYTRDGETVGPLPESGRPSGRREALHARYNTRYMGARYVNVPSSISGYNR
uniref:Repeat domain-containing protein n=1 Tax=Candidatus Kentrum sp. UNK TaxID=2126344 RepID=A0A451AXU6_9GAMM|nr:MAG: Repeat domain-containing protein [Candidatus Kentron sp. UNK]VFK70865.1 MAG: Repeat domain-containing protein [Candidatus Kentron sp. UNK]